MVIKPTELLKDLGMSRVVGDNTLIGILRADMLMVGSELVINIQIIRAAYVFLLFVNMADLEPDVCMGERAGRVPENAVETAEGVFVLSLLLVNDAKPEKDFICFIKI